MRQLMIDDRDWEKLAELAMQGGLVYRGRPSRTKCLAELLRSGEIKASASEVVKRVPEPVEERPVLVGLPSFDDAWNKLSDYQRKALNGFPSSLNSAKRLVDLAQGKD